MMTPMMTPERWSQIQQKLEVAATLEPIKRAAYLDELGATDPSMREELESLLAQQSADTNFLKTSAMDSLHEENGGRDPMIGRRLGPYEVTDLLGVGGMGEVYRAFRADDQYKKRVAIKLVRAGQDSALVISRFKNERQILASLDHANIARLLDGGTTQEGVPYLVMELIEGQPIDDYCDAHKLNITARVQLFMKVGSAVQYAHSRLIVHRDLKPGNILVTTDGQPKLLDFGIAKILDPSAFGGGLEATMTMVRVLTPGYASPEQVRGEIITTASDVYSLGVVLYELLTGHHPYRVTARSAEAIAHAVLEFEPEKPSSAVRRSQVGAGPDQAEITPAVVSALREGVPDKLSRRLRGDLDNIVLTALRKEPERRYVSVEQLDDDLRRHLENLPVSASKDTLRYRVRKFVSRHRTGAVAAVLVTIALLGALVVTLREAQIARAEKARAEQRFNDLRKLANSLMFEVHDSIKDLAGATPARVLLIRRSQEYLDSLAQDTKGDTSLQQELATSYVKLGDLQGNPGQADLGDATGARATYRKALALLEPLMASQPDNRQIQLLSASCYQGLQRISPAQEGESMLRKALAIREALSAKNPNDTQLRRDLATSYSDLSLALGNPYAHYQSRSATAEGLVYSKQALDIRRQLFQAAPGDPDLLFDVFESYHHAADMLWATGQLSEALRYQTAAESSLKDFIARNPTNGEARRLLSTGNGRIATVLEDNGQLAEAMIRLEPAYREILALGAADPQNVLIRRQEVSGYNQMGQLLLQMGNVDEALQKYLKAVELSLSVISADPANPDSRYRLANSYEGLGDALAAKGKLREATEDSHKAVEIREALVAADPGNLRVRGSLGKNYLHLGNIQVRDGRFEESAASCRSGLTIVEPMANADPDNWLTKRVLADLYSMCGTTEAALARHAAPGSAQFEDHRKESCNRFQQTLNVWQDLRWRNVLIEADAPKAADALQRVRGCGPMPSR
jgi:serine/threonine protein kinase/tetratricopeptide (TPR) repeat protein